MAGSRIPRELEQFLSQDSFLLYIKGMTGTGKTSLALTILGALADKENCLYISTKDSQAQIFKHFPWLEKLFKMRHLTVRHNIIHPSDLPIIVDAKLEESTGIFEMITNKLMDTKSPVIIVDSWDAVEYSMDKESLISNIRVLYTWCQRASAKLILIKEQEKDNASDHLADGVVTLKQGYYNGRRIREIEFDKLSGYRVDKPSYLFTLNNSFFKSYGSHDPGDFILTPDWMHVITGATQLRTKKGKALLTTGHKQLDSLLGGGFPARGIVNLELDSDVSPMVPIVFLSRAISNFIDAKNTVLLLPFEGLSQCYTDYLRMDLGSSPESELARFNEDVKRDASRLVTVEQPNMSFERKLTSFQETISKIRKTNPRKLLLTIIGSEFVHKARDRMRDNGDALITFLKSNSDLSIIVSRHPQETSYIAGISDVYLRIVDLKGTLLLQPEKPWSNLYVMNTNKPPEPTKVNLEPLV
jgi:KaiC/GvpD/RAD55 family RecA-like ATPase